MSALNEELWARIKADGLLGAEALRRVAEAAEKAAAETARARKALGDVSAAVERMKRDDGSV